MRSVLAATVVLFALAPLRAQAGCQIQSAQLDIPYDTQHAQQVLDLFVPQTAPSQPAPVAIWLPGGFSGLQAPTPDPCQIPVLAALLARGYVLVTPDLRPMGSNPFPLPVFDCARVVQTVRAKATQWHVDPQRIFLMGRSSGGAVAAAVAYGPELAGVVSTDVVGLQSSRPTAVYLGGAVSNFVALSGSIEGTYFGQPTLATVPEYQKILASPVWWLQQSPATPIPSYLAYKGAIGTPPLADSHDSWSGLDYAIALIGKGATIGYQYDATGLGGTDYELVAQWFVGLYP